MAAAPQPSRTRTGQETSQVPVASPPVEFPRQRKPPPGGIVLIDCLVYSRSTIPMSLTVVDRDYAKIQWQRTN